MESFNLDDRDVVFFEEGMGPHRNSTYRFDEFLAALDFWANGHSSKENIFYIRPFMKEGKECQVLRVQSGWQTGKLIFRLEFIPDEPEESQEAVLLSPSQTETQTPQLQMESPLDDLRADLNIR